ncbi:hypothetical protein OR1_03973 [Geobacter sp. OR-1]|uniref:hypothetical protein n=1 Tax=Geobacter sp. OR-1 TaxID=1266765 RepID=UPI000542B65A|nr:hypothetical protein [Geobacter sp. OR-1]GAM11657.1 hypothetical protein OR1_03973 [Geobacter sp. OR-1]
MTKAIKAITIIDGAIFAVMAGVAAITSARYGTLLLWSGVVVAFVGGMCAVGSVNVAGGEYNLKFDQKIPQLNYNRTDEKLREMNNSYNVGVLMAVAGAVAIVAGLILNKIITGEI